MRALGQVADLARRQDGVVTAAQLVDLGVDGPMATRRVRAGIWQRVHRGVYVVHGGPLPWRTRARAALLYAGRDAALSHAAAAFLHELVERPPRVITVSIPADRRVTATPGLVVRLRRRMPAVQGRLRAVARTDTVIDLLEVSRSVDDTVGLLCTAVRRGVTPAALVEVLRARPAATGRATALELLAEVADGIESPLEHRYHHDVERAHGLPASRLQVRHRLDGWWIRADRLHEGLGVRIELDGQLAHPGGRTDADVWRDNAVVLERAEITLRYRWWHVVVTPCRTADQVARALRAGGWTGRPRPCGPRCALGRAAA